jgi:hypothetical protein
VLTIEDRLAIERLYSAYNRYIDGGRIEEWVELFAPDGMYVSSQTYAGRADLAQFGRKRAESQSTLPYRNAQHWNGNLMLEPDGEIVRGSCYLVRFAVDRETGSKQLVTLGSYEDEIVRFDGSWVFARRQVFPA